MEKLLFALKSSSKSKVN